MSGPADFKELPPMPELPVIRDTYCSQDMADKAISYLWEKKSDLLLKMMNAEKREFIQYDYTRYIPDYLGQVIRFLRKEASQDIALPETDLGMMDLSFELSRRLRKARGLPEYKIPGRPLAAGPEGPFPPELPHLPILDKVPLNLNQEQIDSIIDRAYKQRPDLFWELVEYMRRGLIHGGSAHNELTFLFKDFLPDSVESSDLNSLYKITGEAYKRLGKLCDIPREGGGK